MGKRIMKQEPKHRAFVLNATPRTDQPDRWHVVCGDCAHEWRVTNAYDHGQFADCAEARAFADSHRLINRWINPQKE